MFILICIFCIGGYFSLVPVFLWRSGVIGGKGVRVLMRGVYRLGFILKLLLLLLLDFLVSGGSFLGASELFSFSFVFCVFGFSFVFFT